MAELVILQTPAALLLCAAALFLCLFDRKKKASRGWLSLLSAVLALLAAGIDLLRGARAGKTVKSCCSSASV